MRSHLTPAHGGEVTCPGPHYRAKSTGLDLIISSVTEDGCMSETRIKREVSCIAVNLISHFQI